ncbi:hypothetical protein C5B90_19385 [Haloferax sp. Atlit-12N]|nr:hypothetical protein C5B90_19385 [Haloferax sp. Atlit-12N]
MDFKALVGILLYSSLEGGSIKCIFCRYWSFVSSNYLPVEQVRMYPVEGLSYGFCIPEFI